MSKYAVLEKHKITKRYSRTHEKEMEYAEGYIYNDKKYSDGTYISTTAIVYKNNNEIRTTSGSIYVLK